jgi:hypothetical protein
MVRYTDEQVAFLQRHPTMKRSRLARLFNEHFGTALTEDQIKGKCGRLGLKTGRSGCFKPGHIPYNTGTKGLKTGSSTSFKPGMMPHNWCPVGTEVIEPKDGYTKVKIAEPKTWKHKHVLIWEQKNGPLPQGSCVIFADGDRQNFEPDNLVAVERRELLYLNRKALIQSDKDLTKTAVNIAKVAVRTYELIKKQRD